MRFLLGSEQTAQSGLDKLGHRAFLARVRGISSVVLVGGI